MNRAFKLFAAGSLLLVGIPVGCSLLSTATTVATAPSRVINKTLETNNIIGNYEAFFDRKAVYDTRVNQIATHANLLNVETDNAERQRLRIELAAMKQSCRELATQYNADAQKMNRSIFRDGELPTTLSENACEAA